MEKSHVEPMFENFFAQISPEIAATFTDEQVQALARVFAARQSYKHFVDIRLSLPLLRCYIVVLAGREKRSAKRLQQDRLYHPIWTPVNTLAIAIFFTLLVGSWAGIFYATYQLSHYFFSSSAFPIISYRAIKPQKQPSCFSNQQEGEIKEGRNPPNLK